MTFHNPESGFSVLRIKVRAQDALVTVVGIASTMNPGEDIECFGNWVCSKDYGNQFQAKSIRSIPPSSVEGIEKYLASGIVKGIGPCYAKKIARAFGTQVFEIIDNTPEKLHQVRGIGEKRIALITAAWKDQKIIRSIMVFLQTHGVSTSKAVRIYKTYGDDAVKKVQANPYDLARDIYGIGFKSADQIARNLGIAKDSPMRARAGILFVLSNQVQNGHCGYPIADLLKESNELLEIDDTILITALEDELKEKTVVKEPIGEIPCIYLASLHHTEKELAHLIKRLTSGPLPWERFPMDKAIPWVGNKIGIELAPLQQKAVITALTSKVTIITGGPGTGKSTLTKAIVTLLHAKNVPMALCSPTGRAAKRLAECTGMEAKTIHRTLGYDAKKRGFLHNKENPLPIRLLLLDEASMVDIPLAFALFKALPPQAAVIIIGDSDQLPSVGPGKFLRDLIDSRVIPTVRLTQIFRQAAQSHIIQAAHNINQGFLPNLEHRPDSDFYFVQSDDPDTTVPKIIELVQRRIPSKFGLDPMRDIQVLCPMQRGTVGARNLNCELQKALNPNPIARIERFDYQFLVGDKVMVLRNEYDKDVFNGDMGFITEIDSEAQECVIVFDGREVVFEFADLDILQLAYTVTIHKSQGSEYPAVVIPVLTQHYMMLKRNLIYTGITRGKKLVVLVGQKKALIMAIKALSQNTRLTNLVKRLQDASC